MEYKNILLLFIILLSLMFFYSLSSYKSLMIGVAVEGINFPSVEIDKLKKNLGFNPAMMMFYLSWTDKNNQQQVMLSLASLNNIWKQGSLPCLTWEPKDVLASDVLKGLWDEYLNNMVNMMKSYDKPIIIRLAHEMNLQSYHWGVNSNDYNENTPILYREFFRYIYKFFQDRKVYNVIFAFSPNVDSLPNTSWNRISNYYPGDAWVDIVGLDGYNFGSSMVQNKDGWTSTWRLFSDIFSSAYQELKKISSKKPFFIFETASSLDGGDRIFWVQDALKTARQWNIKGLIWFNINKETDWRLTDKEKKLLKTISAQKWAKEVVFEKKRSH